MSQPKPKRKYYAQRVAEGRTAFERGEPPPENDAGRRGWEEAESAEALKLGREICKRLAKRAVDW